jgi:hypothetical protein
MKNLTSFFAIVSLKRIAPLNFQGAHMKKILVTFATVSLVLSGLALANNSSPAVPALIQVGPNGYVRFTLSGNPALCAAAGGGGTTNYGDIQVGQAGVTNDALNRMLSVLSAAKLSGKSVTVYASAPGTFGCAVFGVEMP